MARSLSSGNNLSLASAVATAAAITLSAWFNPTSAATAGILVSLDDNTNQNAIALRKQATGVITAQTIVAGAASVANTSTTYGAGTWQHACGIEASATDRRAFLNGAGKGTNATSRVPTGISRVNVGFMGGPVVAYAGDLAEPAVWTVALADGEVALLAAGRSPTQIQPAALVSYWRIAGDVSPEPPTIGASSLTLIGTPAKAGTSPTVDDPLSATTGGVSTVAGALTATGALVGASAGVSTASGTLTGTSAPVAVVVQDQGAGAGHGRRSAYLQALLDDAERPMPQPRKPAAAHAPRETIPLPGPGFVGLEGEAAVRERIEARLIASGEAAVRIAATLDEIDAMLAERAVLAAADDDAIAAVLILAA